MIYQRTIKSEVSVIGVGVHSGCRVKLTLKPAQENQGFIFVRSDLTNKPQLKCHPFLVNDTRLSSTLVDLDTSIRVATVEHLMSACACLGIDNLIVEISGTEIPIMDGSSNSFLYLLNEAQVVEQKAKKKYIKIKENLEIKEDDKWVKILPFNGFKVKLSIAFDHPLFKPENNTFEIDFAKESYIEAISRARTFGFVKEIENLRNHGLGLGGNLNNAVVIGMEDDGILNPGGLRYGGKEFVIHKVLDAIGDLYIIGHQIIGFFEGYKSGHSINNKLLRKLINTPDAWEYISFDNEEQVPTSFHYVM